MIRFIVLSVMCITTILLAGPSPYAILSLSLLALSLTVRSRPFRFVALLLYPIIAFQGVPLSSLSNMALIIGTDILSIAPALLLLDICLMPAPYRPSKPSFITIVVIGALLFCFGGLLLALPRVLRIGVYLGTDPTVQVFIVMALTILLTAPVLVPSRPAGPVGRSGPPPKGASGTKTNK